jgi:hypothetical protein
MIESPPYCITRAGTRRIDSVLNPPSIRASEPPGREVTAAMKWEVHVEGEIPECLLRVAGAVCAGLGPGEALATLLIGRWASYPILPPEDAWTEDMECVAK